MAPKLLIDSTPIQLQVVESGEKDGKMVVRGEYAFCGRPTANKRVYTEDLMNKQLTRLANSLSERKVFGELDHPCLSDKDFRVLTLEGWKQFEDVEVGDRVWSRIEGKAVASTVEDIVDVPYQGPIYNIKGKSIDSGFTPNHKFLLRYRPGSYDYYVKASEIAADPSKYRHSPIPKTADFFAEDIKDFVLPDYQGRFKNDITVPLKIPAKLFSAFMGLYLAEGHISSGSKNDSYKVIISQKKEWTRELIWNEVLSKFPEPLLWKKHKNSFYLADARLFTYLKSLGDVYSKYIPREIKNLPSECLKELLYWYTIGDGQDVFSVSESLIRDLNECLVRSGGCGSFTVVNPDKDYEFAGHIIEASNKKPLYQLHFSNSDYIHMDPRVSTLEKDYHDGRVYCLSVTNGNFYMEQNGKCFWTGNSDGRTKLSRTSHLVTNLSIDEQGRVIGESEILNTQTGKDLQALLKSGAQVGVSSRGFGSTITNEKGEEVVQEDYKLVTFDFVADPANHTSYPDVHYEEKEESEMSDKSKVDKQSSDSKKEEIADQAREVFAEERDKIREEVRAELLSDSNTRTDTKIVESLMGLLRDRLLDEETSSLVEEKDKEIKDLKVQLTESERKVVGLEEQYEQLSEVAREIGYKYFLEQLLAGDEDADLIRQLVGNVTDYENHEDLKIAVETSKEHLVKHAEQLAVEEARRERDMAVYEEDKDKLSKKVDQLVEALDKSTELNNALAIEVYTERRLANHPKAKSLREMIKSSRVSSKEEVEEIIEDFDSDNEPRRGPQDLAKVRSRIRSITKGGYSPSSYDEEEGEDNGEVPVSEAANYNNLGVPLAEIKQLAGC